jgi:DnaJ-class molecular chaperone
MGVHSGGEPGDMFVELQIVVPNKISDDARELIKKFDRENPTALERDQFLW